MLDFPLFLCLFRPFASLPLWTVVGIWAAVKVLLLGPLVWVFYQHYPPSRFGLAWTTEKHWPAKLLVRTVHRARLKEKASGRGVINVQVNRLEGPHRANRPCAESKRKPYCKNHTPREHDSEITASFFSARAHLARDPASDIDCITSTRRLVLPLKSVLVARVIHQQPRRTGALGAHGGAA